MKPGTEVMREVWAALIEPGPGFVARSHNVVIWAEPEPGEAGVESLDTVVTGLGDIAAQLLPGAQATTRAAAFLTDVRVAALAGLAAVLPTASGLIALSTGWGEVHTMNQTPDGARNDGVAKPGPGEHSIRMIELTDEVLVLGRRDITARVARQAPHHPTTDRSTAAVGPSGTGLVEGLVPGGAAILSTRISIAGSATEAGPRVEATPRKGAPSATQPVDHDDGNQVEIEGIECVRGHLNNPLALLCGTCGISMIQHSSARVQGTRPSLGTIVLDDGTAFPLTRDVILGSAPDRAEAVIEGRARAAPLVDHTDEIEALHAELRLVGWDVTIVDWSTRGTFLLSEDAVAWQVASRGVPTTLSPGTRIAIGTRTLIFDSTARLATRLP